MKILLLDTETSPVLAHVWGIWNQNVGIPQIIESTHVISFAAKWFGEPEIFFSSIHSNSPKQMIKKVHKLLDTADAVVHYNGTKFDIPMLNKEFVLYGFPPPSPYKQIDLLKTARQQFRFPSNKLEFLAKQLKIGEKLKHSGHELWVRCMAGDPAAWAEMEAYNVQDVILLESLYVRLLPWIKNHPNHGIYTDTPDYLCPSCGSIHVQRRGFSRTQALQFVRYHCQDCGAWSRAPISEKREKTLRPV